MSLSPAINNTSTTAPAPPPVAISMRGVKKQFLDHDENVVDVIKDITIDIYHREFISIVGPSGCGKSTMFNMIAGLLTPTAGEIQVFDQYYAMPKKGRVGYMLQKDLLFPWRTILDNVCLGLEISEVPKKERHERAMAYLLKYGLGDFAHAYPSTLSGGMRQRAALIRTLVIDPDIILLDEPFSALDYQTRLVLEEEILSILNEYGKTVVLITHDIGEAISMSDRIVVMSQRPTWNKKTYEVGLAKQHGSAIGARKDPRYQQFFDAIWGDMDIQLGGRS
ncbi:ABC transporter [Brenneria goodwinii]|uniref:ABC transporter n=1 Tax=Brenneria goodwinii TaxID=1109412 RepID=A0A0G4JPK5_9GAMM|nr:ABC transporter ATP-binding protein [Brenneria goodwinii]ATA24878.1 ABC transporter [Brenneria goodwinii]MCG8155659.1 ABC transporter ATP-binding protein [Brenneria goodwinii]MCG8160314.1 ABC transporter ATP-binding protein [Brenneria goodwinii]MCG8164837.1 ABC transporter ATP-binding protein [Brenneria goodwinii]MCG8169506.1 ABC transporter ATP-binding protein [Brenneria goodwinii]